LRQYSVGEVQEYLREFRLSTSLSHLGIISVRLWTGNGTEYHGEDSVLFTQWQCDFLARELLRVGSEQATGDLGQNEADVEAMRRANGLQDAFQMPSKGNSVGNYEAGLSFIVRTAFEQFPSQSKREYLLPRYLSMFQSLSATVLQSHEPNLADLFESLYGLPLLEFLTIGIGLLGLLVDQPTGQFSAGQLYNHKIPHLANVMTRQKVQAFLGVLSRTVDEFRVELAKLGEPPAGRERSWFNPLWRWPIVALDGEQYLAPSVWLLVQSMTACIYYALQDHFVGDASNQRITGYTSLVGRIFEAHVGAELAAHYDQDHLLAEPIYNRRKKEEVKGPDWTIVDGKRAVLIECKKNSLTLEQRQQGDVPALKAWLRKDVIPAIQKLPQKAQDIEQHVQGLEDWPALLDFEFMIVTLEPCWPEGAIRELIAEELRGTPAEKVRYHLVSAEELELLGSFEAKIRLFDLLRSRWSDAKQTDMRSFIHQRARTLGVMTGSPRLDTLLVDFFHELIPDGASTAG
ncbi:MAG: hypothetical protein JO247_07515, partial [Chloroflexi bacterium]|nr:hypothetical protein [Chloroflexota bacterium]